MRQLQHVLAVLLAGAVFMHAGAASAALGNAKSGLEAAGKVDLDGFEPGAPQSFKTDTEVDLPFDRSIVTVSDAQPGENML